MMNHSNQTSKLAQTRTLSQSIPQQRAFQVYLLIYLLLGVFFIYCAFLIPNGYGNHDDIYRMIETWRSLITEHRYIPSQFQGYLIPELIIGASSQIGGFYLSNIISTILSIVTLFLFYQLLTVITVPLVALLAVAAVGSNPYWIIASTTSTDYVYPAFFFLVGLLLLFQTRFQMAGILFALAVSSRITYGPMAVIAFGFYFPYLNRRGALSKRFFQGVVLFFIASAALYLPVFFTSGMTLSFLGFDLETSGGTFEIIVRFLYKNVYLWSLPTFILILGFLLREQRFYWSKLCSNPFYNVQIPNLLFHAVFWCFLYNELLFTRLPHQYQYLIPVLFCVVYLIATVPFSKSQIICLSSILVLNLVYAVFNLNVIKTYQTTGINQTIHSGEATVSLHLDDSVLVRDYKWRSIYQRRLAEEFNKRWSNLNHQPIHTGEISFTFFYGYENSLS